MTSVAVVLRGLDNGYGIAVSRHIRKRDVYTLGFVSPVSVF